MQIDLVPIVSIVYSFFPSVVIVRMFFVQKGGRWRNHSGQFAKGTHVKLITLIAAGASTLIINPMMEKYFQELSASDPLLLFGFFGIGLLMYFFIFKL